AMWWKRLPEPCAKCRALLRNQAAGRPRAAGIEGGRAPAGPGVVANFGPHDGLELQDSMNYFDDGGVELYRCRCCGNRWEFVWQWDKSACSCRRVQVASAEQWGHRASLRNSAGLRWMMLLVIGPPTLLLVLMRLYAVLVPSADPTFRGPNPWLGLVFALAI